MGGISLDFSRMNRLIAVNERDLDCVVEPLSAPQQLDDAIRAVPGVVGTGLFLGVADHVLVGSGNGVRELRRR